MKIKNLALTFALLGMFAANAQISNIFHIKNEKQSTLKHLGKADSKSLPQSTTHHYWNNDLGVWEYPSHTTTSYDNSGNILITINESYFNGGTDTTRFRYDYQYNAANQEIASYGTNRNTIQQTWDSTNKSFTNYDANGSQILHESYYKNSGNWEFSYGYKSIPTYNANNKVLEEIGQEWVEHLGAYRNSSKSVFGYIGQDVINELIQYEWDTTTSTFILDGRITNIVWYKYDANDLDNSKVGGFTFQGWNDTIFFDLSRISQLYDSHDNETEFKSEDKVGNAWIATSETTNTLTYNTLSQLTQSVTSGRYAPATVFTNSDKSDYSDFRLFSGLQMKQSASTAVVLFPNPMVTSSVLNFILPFDITNSQFVLYNLLGDEVYATPIQSSTTTIERGTLSSGIYYYHILSANSKGLNGKLIIE